MSRKLNNLFRNAGSENRKLLSIFVTAGYPAHLDTAEVILALDEAGIDFVELGIPFSDPIADGPVIQAASDEAIRKGMNLEKVFKIVKQVRKSSQIPIILMGYMNPIYKMGIEKVLELSEETGVDGWIIPDWPLEENESFIKDLSEKDIDLIHLIAPNTPTNRMDKIDQISTSFIYCVAYTGVTGKDNKPSNETIDFLNKVRNRLNSPLMIGFGIKNREDFQNYSNYADGVIVGSAFIKSLKEMKSASAPLEIKKFVHQIRGLSF